MTDLTTEARVKRIIAEHLGVALDRLHSGESLSDLGADSLDHIELTMAAEEEFDISIPDEDAEGVKTVGDAVAMVKKARGETQ